MLQYDTMLYDSHPIASVYPIYLFIPVHTKPVSFILLLTSIQQVVHWTISRHWWSKVATPNIRYYICNRQLFNLLSYTSWSASDLAGWYILGRHICQKLSTCRPWCSGYVASTDRPYTVYARHNTDAHSSISVGHVFVQISQQQSTRWPLLLEATDEHFHETSMFSRFSAYRYDESSMAISEWIILTSQSRF